MRLRHLYLGLVALLLGVSFAIGNVQPTNETAEPTDGRLVYVIPVEGLISDVMLMSMQRRTEMAEEAGADLIVYEIDTYGGLVTSALEISTFIKNVRTETLAWVNDKAISAGAIISVAADGIVMAERSRIGDAAPIMPGQQLEGTERAKQESPILEEFRDSALRNGYPVILTEGMVRLGPAIYQIENVDTGDIEYVYSTELPIYGLESPRGDYTPPPAPAPPQPQQDQQPTPFGSLTMQVDDAAVEADPEAETSQPEANQTLQAEVEGDWRIVQLVNPANTLVTLSQDEAIAYGFASQIIADDSALMALTGATAETFVRLEMSWSEDLANLLVSPGVRAILLILLLLGGYMELQSPGLGLPGAVAVVALLLMVGGPFIAGLADMTAVLIIAGGLILIAVELFLIPGIGVAGILGVLMVLTGFLMTFVPPDPEPGWLPALDATWDGLRQGVSVLLIAIIVTGIAGYFISRNIERVPFFRRLVLEGTVDAPTTSPTTSVPPASARAESQTYARGAATDMPEETAAAAPPPGQAVREGVIGRALTGLRPAGRVEIDGQIVDVVTGGRWVEVGQNVRIVEIRGNRIVVEEA